MSLPQPNVMTIGKPGERIGDLPPVPPNDQVDEAVKLLKGMIIDIWGLGDASKGDKSSEAEIQRRIYASIGFGMTDILAILIGGKAMDDFWQGRDEFTEQYKAAKKKKSSKKGDSYKKKKPKKK